MSRAGTPAPPQTLYSEPRDLRPSSRARWLRASAKLLFRVPDVPRTSCADRAPALPRHGRCGAIAWNLSQDPETGGPRRSGSWRPSTALVGWPLPYENSVPTERRFQPVSATNSASLSFGIIPPGVSLGLPLKPDGSRPDRYPLIYRCRVPAYLERLVGTRRR